jgi:type I restriction enzyme S subunit
MIEGLKPYPEYKESGLPWLGHCPKNWSVRRTKILFQERVQKGFPNEPLLAATQRKGVVKKEDYETRTVTAQKDLHLLKLVEVGDYVISLRSFQGGIEVAHCRGIISPAYTVLKLRKTGGSGYYSHFFKAKPFIDSLSLFVTGIREGQNIDYERLSRAELPMPSEEEQAAIVRFLDHANRKIDGFIRAKRKLIGLLNEQKQAIIHRAVTRGLHPDVPLKPSGIPWLGDIPKHWEVLPLGRVLIERKEKNDPIKTKNILSLSLHDGVVPYAEKTRPGGNKAKDDLTAYKLAYPGDIVVNSMNVVVGSVGLSRYFGAVSPVYYMLRPRQSTDTVEYFDSIFHDVAFQRSLFGLGNGIMVIQSKSSGKLNTIRMRIPMGKLNRVEIPYPPPSEQQTIVAGIGTEIAPVITAIDRTEREIALMQEYRTRLTADVVTGKLDVREAAVNLPDSIDDGNAEESSNEISEESEEEILES